MAPLQPIIDARLVKRFPPGPDSEAFELNVHFSAGAGITVLSGPSGAGKTLILNCIAGFAHADEGRILVHDELFFDAAAHVHLSPRQRRCGYLFQDHALFPHMTVRQNLRFAASVARPRSRGLNRHRQVNELLEVFELSDLAARMPAQLSGGQKQRAALARMLITDPTLLLLDEPTRGLDARLRRAFYDVLRTILDRRRVPVVLVTHDLDECFELADAFYLLERGRILQSGPIDAVFDRPANLDIARSLGIYNIVPATITALDPGRHTSRISVLNCDIDGPYLPGHFIGDHGFLCMRQSEMRVHPASDQMYPNSLLLRIAGTSRSPQGIRILFEHDVVATVSETEFEALRGSERLQLEIPPPAVYFIA